MQDLWLYMDNSASLMLGINLPAFITWSQFIFFLVLYSVSIFSELVSVRNTALVFGVFYVNYADLTQHNSGEPDSLFGRLK